MLIPHPSGRYRFLQGIDPYSCGVVAEPGCEIVRTQLAGWLPWREGFEYVDRFLEREGLDRGALCAMELRSPHPFPMDGFVGFNRGYCAVLESWGLLVEGLNPVARTNVAPEIRAPDAVSLHAFSFVRVNPEVNRRTFIVAGAGELREGILESERIVRLGDLSAAGLLAKGEYVLSVMEDRLRGLGVGWGEVTRTNVYTVHQPDDALRGRILERMGEAVRSGVTWHMTRPPVVDIEFEMDLHGVARDLLSPAEVFG